MDGIEFLRLCERDARPCAGIIREQLQGWPKQVLDPDKLKRGRIENLACPPHREDRALADLFVRNASQDRSVLRGKPMQEAIGDVFARAFPACASSRDS